MRRLSLFLLSATFAAIVSGETPVQSEELASAVARDGAETVVRRLYDDRANWDVVMSHISSGDHSWVSLGIALLAGSDAGATSEIHDALFPALGRDPGYLLRQPPSLNFDAIEICRGRHDPLATYKEAEAEQRAVRAKVAALGGNLGERRRQCLAALDSGIQDLQRYFEVEAK